MSDSCPSSPSFYEFFAGGGMVRAGLGPDWTCLFANDFDVKKGFSYQANWGTGGELTVSDIRDLDAGHLPGNPDMVWASFPCQDLSLAGRGGGLKGERSGTFYAFWDIVNGLIADGRAPRIVAVENVCGALTSKGGADFEAICRTFAEAGYRYGALVINADQFVPQSRPRLFVIGVAPGVEIAADMLSPEPMEPFHTRALRRAVARLPEDVTDKLLWWNLPTPERRLTTFADIIEDKPKCVTWHSYAETRKLLDMMSPLHLAKVAAAKRSGRKMVGGVYRRTRRDAEGNKVQRAEVRFDDVAGCLRTPSGGSSRQTLLVVEGRKVRSRLISSRETARLMGLSDHYILPRQYNDAYHLTGDGVVAPVVSHLTQYIFRPLIITPSADEKSVAA